MASETEELEKPKKVSKVKDDNNVQENSSTILTKIQNEVKAPKGSYNSFGKYKYRTVEQILEAVKPVLLKYPQVSLTVTDDIVVLNNKIFMKAIATLVVGDDRFEVCGYAETGEHKGMSSEQTTGTASTYARKYALNGLFLIDESEVDPDSLPKELANANQIKEITELALQKSIELVKVASGVSNSRTSVLEELTKDEATKAIGFLKQK